MVSRNHLVSIIVPLYNKESYVESTILSVLAQTYNNWELLIVDNGSTDNSVSKVQQFQDTRLRLLTSPQKGPGIARNFGLVYAQGTWILFLDSDDLLEPDYIESQLKAVEQNPQGDIVAGCWQEFSDENPWQRIMKRPVGMGLPNQALRDAAFAFAPWAVHSALVRRSVLTPEFYWPEALDSYVAEDIAFWFKLVNQYVTVYSQSVGALYRTVTPQNRNQNQNAAKWFEGVHKAIQLNELILTAQGHKYTPQQCEFAMLVYCDLYLRAKRQHNNSIRAEALSIAYRWMGRYFASAAVPKPKMLASRVIGLPIFAELRDFVVHKRRNEA